MHKNININKKLIIVIAAALLVMGAVMVFFIIRNKNKITATTMRLMEMQGTVTLESGGKIKEIIDNLKLNSGDVLSTAGESFVSISLDDYKMVKIHEKSRAEFIQSGKELALNLVEGSLFFDVSKKLDADETFQISTSTMVVGIRGTSGYVFVEQDGADGILITDGTVEITGINPITGEEIKTTAHAGQIVHVYILDDDEKSVTFTLENATEKDLPPEVVDFLVEHPELMDRVCQATGWDKAKIKEIYEKLHTPKEEEEVKEEEKEDKETEEEDNKEEVKEDEQDPPKEQDSPKQQDPPAVVPDEQADVIPVIPPAEPPLENTDDQTNDDDDDDDDDDSPVPVSQLEMVLEASVDVGSTISLSCSVFPSNATNKSLSWTTSDSSVATVNSSGVVTGVSAGSATITATACDGSGKSASCDVSVSEVVVNQITAESQVNVSVGGTVQVYYALSPDNAANKSMIWEINDSSDDPTDVASVDNNGRVTGLRAGHTRIYGYSVANPSIGALVHVYVNSFGISVSPSPLTLEDDGYAEMTITASGMTAEQLGQYQWYASCSDELELDPTVGTFSNSSGNGVGVFNVRKKSTAQSEDILNVNVIVKKISDSSVVAEKDITVYIE